MAEAGYPGLGQRLSHAFCCRDRMSLEAAQAVMRESYGLDLTAGEIREILDKSSCENCAAQAAQAHLPEPEPVRPVVHQATTSGLLTGSWPFDG